MDPKRGSGFAYLCQAFVSAHGEGGDSGGPVFRRISGSDSETDVKLHGVISGLVDYDDDGDGEEFVYSPFSAVVNELGAMITH